MWWVVRIAFREGGRGLFPSIETLLLSCNYQVCFAPPSPLINPFCPPPTPFPFEVDYELTDDGMAAVGGGLLNMGMFRGTEVP